MKAYYRNHRGEPFIEPEGIVHQVICEESGLMATRGCSRFRREVFIEGTEPRRHCDRHSLSSQRMKKAGSGYEDLDRSIMDDD